MCPRSLLCGPRGESGPSGSYAGEREQAMALLAAAKHLPTQLLSSQAEVKGKCCQLSSLLLKLINAGIGFSFVELFAGIIVTSSNYSRSYVVSVRD